MDIGIIDANNIKAIEGYLVEKGEECAFNLIDILVEIKMFTVNVRGDSNGREKKKERTIALISLCNKELAAAELSITPEAV